MRVLFLIRDLDFGGAQRQVCAIAAGLRARGHSVRIAYWRNIGSMAADLAAAGVPLIKVVSRWRGDILGLSRAVRKIVVSEQVDVVYSMMPVENLVAGIARRGTNCHLVWGVRTSPGAVRRVAVSQQFLFFLQGILSSVPDAIVANSSAGLRLVLRSRPGEGRFVIRNGTDTDRFRPDPVDRVAFRRELGLSDDQVILLVVGRVERQKGIGDFLSTMSALVRTRPNVHALLVGRVNQEYAPVLTQTLERLGLSRHVRFLGQREDMPRLYAVADVLVSASLGEGMSNVVGEAMASGLAVVAAREGENEELVANCGWLYQPGSEESFHHMLEMAVDGCRSARPTQARNRILSEFSTDRVVSETEAMLGKIVGNVG